MNRNNLNKFFFLILSLFCISMLSAQEFGITQNEITKILNTGHSLQLWEVLPEYTKNGDYEISIKHAIAGEKGGFYIIAWADTNNDGKPDKEIGRSELKTASSDGEWSSWKFTSNYDRIFVGNTWKISDEQVYYQMGGTIDGFTGLTNKIYYSNSFNGKPNRSTSPRFTNIRVKYSL